MCDKITFPKWECPTHGDIEGEMTVTFHSFNGDLDRVYCVRCIETLLRTMIKPMRRIV